MFFSKFPIINLDLAELRQIKENADAEHFYNYMNHEKVARFLSADDIPNSLEGSRTELAYWASLYTTMKSIYWAIANSNGQLIGTCGFNSWNKSHKRAEISYDLSVDYWGRGIMTQAIQSITKFAFENMKVRRVQATVSVENGPSMRVLEKCGYIREGLLAKFGVLQQQSQDYYMYAVVI